VRRQSSSKCAGFTLYEVVLSLAILAASLAVLSSLIATGSRAATQSRLRTEAMLLCQTKLAEVVSGVEPLAAVSGAPLVTAAPGWTWDLQVTPGPHVDLLALQVTVSHAAADNSVDAGASLSRWIRNPQLFAQAASAASTASQPPAGE
jgi:general secretion pathway protein I